MFCFGGKALNDDLIKAGSMIGMGAHGIFEGGWDNVKSGAKAGATFKPGVKLTTHVIVDLGKGKAVLEVGKSRVESDLPEGLKSIEYIGIYAKATTTDFSQIEVER